MKGETRSRQRTNPVCQRITHAGYQRIILKRNPKRYDEDGDELEDDDVDEEADADAARRDPYGHIRIEGIAFIHIRKTFLADPYQNFWRL